MRAGLLCTKCGESMSTDCPLITDEVLSTIACVFCNGDMTVLETTPRPMVPFADLLKARAYPGDASIPTKTIMGFIGAIIKDIDFEMYSTGAGQRVVIKSLTVGSTTLHMTGSGRGAVGYALTDGEQNAEV